MYPYGGEDVGFGEVPLKENGLCGGKLVMICCD